MITITDAGDARRLYEPLKWRRIFVRNNPTTGELLAIDPSIRSCGVALFRAGRLAEVARITMPSDTTVPIAARCLRMAYKICEWADSNSALPRVVAFEWPQVYRAGKSKCDPNSLTPLAGVGCSVAALVSAYHPHTIVEVLSPTPAAWAGQLPKSTKARKESPRAKRIRSRLDEDEARLWYPGITHDEIDAIGIGLYALDRFKPLRVIAGDDQAGSSEPRS